MSAIIANTHTMASNQKLGVAFVCGTKDCVSIDAKNAETIRSSFVNVCHCCQAGSEPYLKKGTQKGTIGTQSFCYHFEIVLELFLIRLENFRTV